MLSSRVQRIRELLPLRGDPKKVPTVSVLEAARLFAMLLQHQADRLAHTLEEEARHEKLLRRVQELTEEGVTMEDNNRVWMEDSDF